MKGYKHLTAEQKAAILEVYERTKIVTLTAEQVGVSQYQVRNYLWNEGIPLSGAQERSTCWQHRALLRELAAQGASLSEMARQTGANRRHIQTFLKRHEIPYEPFRQAGENNPAWRGGRVTDKHGYILIHQPDHPNCDRHGYVREHRLVMERELGRLLLPTEVVDHKDGQRANNDPSNLTVYLSNKEHLAATLKGRTPNWTPEGQARLRGPRPRRKGHEQSANPAA